ncbi:MAG: hypothetical protein DYG89_12060 [Caldilinea sp. CFX5]|nr:hypothetical protein [Caldilinea sp. CFX5]
MVVERLAKAYRGLDSLRQWGQRQLANPAAKWDLVQQFQAKSSFAVIAQPMALLIEQFVD